MPNAPTTPPHIEDTVRAIARLRNDHDMRATSFQRNLDRITANVGSPGFVVVLTVLVVTWVAVNCFLLALGGEPIDGPPFIWMQGAIALAALYMTVLILTTQRRENELASHHEQLTLELAILSEQKSAKIISLLEELRKDHPEIRNRVDKEAAAMAAPADPHSVLEAIKTHTKILGDDLER
jgi:uncharacterized membrane protein